MANCRMKLLPPSHVNTSTEVSGVSNSKGLVVTWWKPQFRSEKNDTTIANPKNFSGLL